jgi:hypothetical protein
MGKSNQRKMIIIGIMGIIGTGIVTSNLVLPYLNTHTTKIEDTSLNYTDKKLGFQITRLTLDWKFDQNITKIGLENGIVFSKDMLGGVRVESPEGIKITIIVFNETTPNFVDLGKFTQQQIFELKSRFHVTSLIAGSSLDNSSKSFQVTARDNSTQVFFKEMLERHKGKVYLVQGVVTSPQAIPDKTLNNLEKAYERFEYIL